ncbi:MAG: hypothetical protein E7657_02830 [Ruminococcaceae bacterium]|nr:hypothetical protein [Oscillospiraceae bacterium]
MDYNKIILEMLGRIQTLEEKVALLETEGKQVIAKKNSVGLTQTAREYILSCKYEAKAKGKTEVTLLCNDIQKELHVKNRPYSICRAMYDCMGIRDEVLSAPPSGFSTTVKIKYYIE